MITPENVAGWPDGDNWTSREGLRSAHVREAEIVVFFRPSPYGPDHTTDFVICQVDGYDADTEEPLALEAIFAGFRKWDGCTQIRALTTEYVLHYDDSDQMKRALAAIHMIVWSDELAPKAAIR
jgi:hypothetical protein